MRFAVTFACLCGAVMCVARASVIKYPKRVRDMRGGIRRRTDYVVRQIRGGVTRTFSACVCVFVEDGRTSAC